MSIRFPILYLVLFLAVALVFFWNRASVQGRLVNTDVTRTDQNAYIRQGIKMRISDFSCVHPRNRMPLYPGLLALFMDKQDLEKIQPGISEGAMLDASLSEYFFETGKRINMALATLLAVFLAVVFFRTFPLHHALNLWALAVFGVLVFKAAFTQAEVLYYFLTFAAFLACWCLFKRPGIFLAAWGGLLLGVAHLTKASVLPGVLVLAVFYPLDALWRCRHGGGGLFRRLAAAAVLVAAFFVVIGPYILQSKRMFDRYFYNVNSTFYMWCDSWDEAKSRTYKAGDRMSFPNLPPEELPGPINYFRSHTADEAFGRILKGISVVFHVMTNSYGYLGPCLAYLGFAILLVAALPKLVWRVFRRRPFAVLALVAYFCGYYLLVAWYSPVICGNRFILGLFLPFLFTMSAVIVKLAPRLRWQWRGRPIHVLTLFNGALSLWLAVEVGLTAFIRVGTIYGGG